MSAPRRHPSHGTSHRVRSRYDLDDDDDDLMSLYEDALHIVDERKRAADSLRQAEDAEKDRVAAIAVEKYKEDVMRQVEEVQRHAKAQDEDLRRVFNHEADQRRIDQYIETLRVKELRDIEAGKLLGNLGAKPLAGAIAAVADEGTGGSVAGGNGKSRSWRQR